MAWSTECQCDHRFTCRHCLRNAKPWHYTLSDGSALYVAPFQGAKKSEENQS